MTPDMAARITATIVVCSATPPLNPPAKIDMASKRSRAMPDRSRIEAMSTKNGTATSGYFSSRSSALTETR